MVPRLRKKYYLSQSYLSLLLLQNLAKSSLGRIVFVSSESHRFHNLNGSSKLLNFEVYSNPIYKQYSAKFVFTQGIYTTLIYTSAKQHGVWALWHGCWNHSIKPQIKEPPTISCDLKSKTGKRPLVKTKPTTQRPTSHKA